MGSLAETSNHATESIKDYIERHSEARWLSGNMDYVVVAVLATLCAAMQCIVVRAPSMTWQRIWSPELGYVGLIKIFFILEWFRIFIQFAFSSSSPSYSSFASKNCPCDHYPRCSGDAPGSRRHLPTGSSLLAPGSGEGEE